MLEPTQKSAPPSLVQMVYGILLTAAGIGVFFRFDQVIPPKLGQFQTFSSAMWVIRVCFYLMAIILIGGGLRKIVRYFKPGPSPAGDQRVDSTDS